jgi:hypothetical protein
MDIKTRKRRGISVENALKGVGASARRKAFLHNRPVAISSNGKTYLIYSDGSQKLVTPQLLLQLRNGKA